MEKLLRMADVMEVVGFSQSHINDLVRTREFPAPIRIGASARWPQSVVQEWLKQKIMEGSKNETNR